VKLQPKVQWQHCESIWNDEVACHTVGPPTCMAIGLEEHRITFLTPKGLNAHTADKPVLVSVT
jgi:hypothetical protein